MRADAPVWKVGSDAVSGYVSAVRLTYLQGSVVPSLTHSVSVRRTPRRLHSWKIFVAVRDGMGAPPGKAWLGTAEGSPHVQSPSRDRVGTTGRRDTSSMAQRCRVINARRHASGATRRAIRSGGDGRRFPRGGLGGHDRAGPERRGPRWRLRRRVRNPGAKPNAGNDTLDGGNGDDSSRHERHRHRQRRNGADALFGGRADTLTATTQRLLTGTSRRH